MSRENLLDDRNKEEALRQNGFYLLTFDTKRALARFTDLSNFDLSWETDRFNNQVSLAVRRAFGDSFPIVSVSEDGFYRQLDGMLDAAVRKAAEIGGRAVLLDRFIFPIFSGENDFSKISVSRSITQDGQIVIKERPGDQSVDLQFTNLEREVSSRGLQRKVIVVDDGLFDIECLEVYEDIFSRRGYEIAGYYVGISPYGDGNMDTRGVITRSGRFVNDVLPVCNPTDWVCLRDFVFYGGKTRVDQKTGQLLTVPYFAPFSDGSGASIPPEQLVDLSRDVLTANIGLVEAIENKIGRTLSFSNAMTAGYGLPVSLTGEFRQARPDENIKEYLTEALISLGSGFKKIFNTTGLRNVEVPELDSALLTKLQDSSDKLIILCGSSGTGRSTLANAITENAPGSERVRRTTTRERRSGNEQREIITTSKQNFLNKVTAGEIFGPVYYPPNQQLYGLEVAELTQKLLNLGTGGFAVVEGAEDVLKIKRLLPRAKVVLVLPPSVDAIDSRIKDRESGTREEAELRIRETADQLRLTINNLPSMINSGLVDMVIVNDNPNTDAVKVISAIRNGEKVFENIESLAKSLT